MFIDSVRLRTIYAMWISQRFLCCQLNLPHLHVATCIQCVHVMWIMELLTNVTVIGKGVGSCLTVIMKYIGLPTLVLSMRCRPDPCGNAIHLVLWPPGMQLSCTLTRNIPLTSLSEEYTHGQSLRSIAVLKARQPRP